MPLAVQTMRRKCTLLTDSGITALNEAGASPATQALPDVSAVDGVEEAGTAPEFFVDLCVTIPALHSVAMSGA